MGSKSFKRDPPGKPKSLTRDYPMPPGYKENEENGEDVKKEEPTKDGSKLIISDDNPQSQRTERIRIKK